MRTVRDVMRSQTVSVAPNATMQAAVLKMRTHACAVLPVVNANGSIAGVLEAASAFMFQPDVLVEDVMPSPASVEAGAGLSAAAALMKARCLPELPVVENGILVGTVRSGDLLTAWAMPVDPLTGLPWQDSFRLRSAMQIAAGHEPTLLFFDMNNFGALNKRYGHIVGDRALKAVAAALKAELESSLDEACRFGGDEFVVSTIRPRADAAALAYRVRAALAGLVVEGMDAPLSVSVGVAGGLRHGGRPAIHPPATLDDLLNRASQASTRAKTSAQGVGSLDDAPVPPSEHQEGSGPAPEAFPSSEEASVSRPSRVRLAAASVIARNGRVAAEVRLERGGETGTGRADAAAHEAARAVADATLHAMARFLPSGHALRAVRVSEPAAGEREPMVTAELEWTGPQGPRTLMGAAADPADAARAAAKAVLQSANRTLEPFVPAAANRAWALSCAMA